MKLSGRTDAVAAWNACKAGWPRPFAWHPRFRRWLPVPWVNGIRPVIEGEGRGWLRIERDDVAEQKRLCFCCGLPMEGRIILGRHRTTYRTGDRRHVRMTEGPGGHPRCMLLATKHCPHLRSQHEDDPLRVVAFAYDGKGVGYIKLPVELNQGPRRLVQLSARPVTLGRLRYMAREDPMGVLKRG